MSERILRYGLLVSLVLVVTFDPVLGDDTPKHECPDEPRAWYATRCLEPNELVRPMVWEDGAHWPVAAIRGSSSEDDSPALTPFPEVRYPERDPRTDPVRGELAGKRIPFFAWPERRVHAPRLDTGQVTSFRADHIAMVCPGTRSVRNAWRGWVVHSIRPPEFWGVDQVPDRDFFAVRKAESDALRRWWGAVHTDNGPIIEPGVCTEESPGSSDGHELLVQFGGSEGGVTYLRSGRLDPCLVAKINGKKNARRGLGEMAAHTEAYKLLSLLASLDRPRAERIKLVSLSTPPCQGVLTDMSRWFGIEIRYYGRYDGRDILLWQMTPSRAAGIRGGKNTVLYTKMLEHL